MLDGDRHLYLGPFGFWGRKKVRAAVRIDELVENEVLRNQVMATGFCVSPMLFVLLVLAVPGRKVLFIQLYGSGCANVARCAKCIIRAFRSFQ